MGEQCLYTAQGASRWCRIKTTFGEVVTITLSAFSFLFAQADSVPANSVEHCAVAAALIRTSKAASASRQTEKGSVIQLHNTALLLAFGHSNILTWHSSVPAKRCAGFICDPNLAAASGGLYTNEAMRSRYREKHSHTIFLYNAIYPRYQ